MFRISRMSLKEGATNLREEMVRAASCRTKASSSARGVKKVDILGTSMLNFERDLVLWWTTASRQEEIQYQSLSSKLTVIIDELLDISKDICISLTSTVCHHVDGFVRNSIIWHRWLRVEHKWDSE